MKLTEQDVIRQLHDVDVVQLRSWIELGWVSTAQDHDGPGFEEIDLARVRLVHQLHRELELDEETLPMVLSLIDQLYGTRRDLKAVLQALALEADEVQARVRERYRAARAR